MNKYKEFVLLARSKTGSVKAPGFGAPAKSNKKPNKEQLAHWRSRSQEQQEAYLKKYPNSMFRNVPSRGSIITRSKKISRSPSAKAVTEKSVEALKAWGVKGRALSRKTAHTMIGNANKFLNGVRSKFIDQASSTFDKFKKKLSKSEQNDIDEEVQQIVKTNRPPSKTILARGLKGVFPALLGVAITATVFGGIASGFIPPEAIAFAGVKALDAAWNSIRHVTSESGGLTAFIVGSVLKDYLNSKDADDDIEKTKYKMKKAYGDPDDESDDEKMSTEETKEEPAKTEEPKEETKEEVKPETKPEPPKSTQKDLGFEIDREKYEQDANGNWIRKKK